MKIVPLLHIAVLVGFLSFPFASAAAERDARCVIVGFAKEPVCFVSFMRLIAREESYYGRLVQIGGVVRKIPDGGIMLYPSLEQAQNHLSVDALVVLSEDMPGDQSIEEFGWVVVVGRFINPSDRSWNLYAGFLNDIIRIQRTEPVPSSD